jgi:DNA mismatch repair protein MutH
MANKITLAEALEALHSYAGRRVRDFAPPSIINKGSAGQILEEAIGLRLSSDLLDFADGELKTNKFLNGRPAETVAITQVGHVIPEILSQTSWESTSLARKINSFILLPVHKDSADPGDWTYGKAVHFNSKDYPKQYLLVEKDYESVAAQIRNTILNNGELHTFNGPAEYLQIRSKDSKRPDGSYNPIFVNGRKISNKNYAFYFRTNFLASVLNF